MLDAKENPTSSIELIQAWYANCDPSLLGPDFTCTAVGYGTKKALYEGATGMLEEFFGEIGGSYEHWSLDVDRMIDAGKSITVLGAYNAKKRNEKPRRLPYVHVWDLSKGRIQCVTCFTDVTFSAGLSLAHQKKWSSLK